MTPPAARPWFAEEIRDFHFERHDCYALLHVPHITLDEEGVYSFEVGFGADGGR